MSIEISRYQFHSWARTGIASTIEEPDDLGENASIGTQRAQINLPILLNEQTKSKNFSLIGPGDIIGLNSDTIVRTQPLNRIMDFEPNFLAFIEFFQHDLLWRYTPGAPKLPGSLPNDPPTNKLRPWLFLLLVKEEEFKRTKRKIPLPSITLTAADVFPPANETWLWAHVHSDINIPDEQTNDLEEFLIALNKNVTTDPDQLYCRLMSPRQLEPNTPYFAFLVPSFETGRLAGLGEKEETISAVVAQKPSWSNTGANGEMPIYYEWYFRTGDNEDFESLIKKLEPITLDEHVGIRDMDCAEPGFIKADGSVPFPGTIPSVIGLEGALKSPKVISTSFPQEGDQFQIELEEVVNLPFKVIGTDEETGDPIVSVPLYGGKHAKKNINKDIPLDISRHTWLHDLNKDPRTRVAAGFGTVAIQKNQETYMRKAWSQIQTILDANKKIKATVFHMNVALKFAQKTFNQVSSTVLMAMSRPVLPRIMGSPTTLLQQIKESKLPAAVFSGSFRKLSAPNRRFAKKNETVKFDFNRTVTRLNEGTLTAEPPKESPAGIFTFKEAAANISPGKFPLWLQWIVDNRKILAIILLIAFIGLSIITSLYLIIIPLAAGTVAGYVYANNLANDKDAAETLLDPQKEVEAVTKTPQRPNFTLKINSEITTPPPTLLSSGADSVEAKNYRIALTEMTKRVALKAPEKVVPLLSLTNTYNKLKEGINPNKTFAKKLSGQITFPGNIKPDEPKKILPAMAYPDMDDPMYKKLIDISDEAFLPNLKFIKNNTISLLITNPKFIESYMVGLNHEMGRELLWREYPTDQRGSYFRQFWDVSGIISPSSPDGNLTAEEKAKFKDITPIHTWDEATEDLGVHNNRVTQTPNEAQLVLTIRGDLLKKYPNTLVFAQKAIPALPGDEDNDDGTKIERELSDADFKTKVKFPLYRAEVLPDIKFFGFDLTVERAKGDSPGSDADNLGWYFIIMQAPGSPVFGMDISFNQGDDGLSWDDLSWKSFSEEVKFIKKELVPNIHPPETIAWGADSASMAYILFQKPSMIAVHAKKMLKGL